MKAVLTIDEFIGYAKELRLQIDCDYLLGEIQVNIAIANGIITVRKLSELRAKEFEWTAIERINGIIKLCNGEKS